MKQFSLTQKIAMLAMCSILVIGLLFKTPVAHAASAIPVGAGPYALTKANNYLYVNNSTDGSISVIDLTTNKIVTTISSGVPTSPNQAIVIGNQLYVGGNSSIVDIDVQSNTIVGQLICLGDMVFQAQTMNYT